MAVVRLKFCVHIFLAITLILEVLESLAVGDILALKIDGDYILAFDLELLWDVKTMAVPDMFPLLTKIIAIDRETSDLSSLVVNEETL